MVFFIIYLGQSMLRPMPVAVKWASKKKIAWITEEIFTHKCRNIRDSMKHGYCVEVSLIYPEKVKRRFRK